MGVQPILKGDIPELRTVSEPVTSFDKELHQLLDDLACTLHSCGGIGLAAPQIGRPLRAFVVDIGDGVLEFVNPEVDKSAETQDSVESCLSLPELTLQVKRPASVTVRALDRNGAPFERVATGLLARVICHEADHLDGVLFMDHLSDEEVFQQMWMSLGASLQEELDAAEEAKTCVHPEAVCKARWEEIRLAADMLADASWRWTLAVEILKDHVELVHADDLDVLKELEAHMQSLSDHWQQMVENSPRQAEPAAGERAETDG